MKWILICLVLAMSGCEFARGFRDQGSREVLDIGVEMAADKLGKEVSDRIDDLSGKLPADKGPVEEGLLYALGGLAAYIIGSYGKGKIREARAKKSA